jgi:hypothetical protein
MPWEYVIPLVVTAAVVVAMILIARAGVRT